MSIKDNVGLYALEVGRMLGLNRRLTEIEQSALYERFICGSHQSTQSIRFGDFLAWVCVHIDKSDKIFG